MNAGLKDGDARFRDLVDAWGQSADVDEELNFKPKPLDDPWRKPFLSAREIFTSVESVNDDDIPLSADSGMMGGEWWL